MMTIRFLQTTTTHRGVFQPGEIAEMETPWAVMLCEKKAAHPVTRPDAREVADMRYDLETRHARTMRL
jgi:hypothetical protein